MANFLPTSFTSGCSSNQGRVGFILLLNMYCAQPSASRVGTFSLKLHSNRPHSYTQYYMSSRFKETGGNQALSKPTENSYSPLASRNLISVIGPAGKGPDVQDVDRVRRHSPPAAVIMSAPSRSRDRAAWGGGWGREWACWGSCPCTTSYSPGPGTSH